MDIREVRSEVLERNRGIDLLRVILAFLVVALHVFPVTGLDGAQAAISYEIVNGLTRIAVPCFFLITGCYVGHRVSDRAYFWKYEKRILLLYVVWQLIYSPILIWHYLNGNIGLLNILSDLLFGYWHLWYLSAAAGGVVLLALVQRLAVRSQLLLALAAFLAGYAIQLVNCLGMFPDRGAFFYFYKAIGTPRDAIFMAFPLMVIGSAYETWIPYLRSARRGAGQRSISTTSWLCFALTCLLVESLVYYHALSGSMDFYISIIPLSMLIFDLAARSAVSANINRSLPMGIYLCHPYAVLLLNAMFLSSSLLSSTTKYVAVSALAALAWLVVDRVNRRLPVFF